MRFLALLCSISTLLPAILAGPLPLSLGVEIETHPGEKVDGGYIVQLQDGASKAGIIEQVTALVAGKLGKGITHEYDTIFEGFAGIFDSVTLAALQTMPGVLSIVEDGIFRTTTTQALNYVYNYNEKAGEGVDIYVIDTGIRVSHDDFGGRAEWSFSAPSYAEEDGNGHGTHCAGTAVGGRYGVAKKAKVYAVKVLSDEGSGTVSDILLGMLHVAVKALSSGRPSVVSMSLGGGANGAMDSGVRSLANLGIHVVVAAGNANEDAKDTSPARVEEVITVGASNITDGRAFFSNYGPAVDVFAPGLYITSAFKDSDTSTLVASGTSMATPHVAGLVAYLISVEGNTTPKAMSQKIKDRALRNRLAGIPDNTLNLLAHNATPNGHAGI